MIIRFDGFELDPAARTLTKGGDPIALKPRPMALLCYLAEHRGRLVDKQEVVTQVWRGTAVSDSALSSAVRDIRRAVENAGAQSDVIRTHYGHGFEFVAEATAGDAMPAPAPNHRAYPRSLAVLPLTVHSDATALRNHAFGLAEDVIVELSKFRSLRVLARKSTFAFEGQGHSVRDIASALSADFVLEGSLRDIGDAVRLNMTLIDASDETNVWVESIDVAQGDFASGAARAVEVIVGAVPKLINDHELQRSRALKFEQLDPWQCYLRGSERLETFLPEHQIEAIALFERAIELDPSFADPHASLAYALCVMNQNLTDRPGSDRRSELRLRSLEEARKATALDANMDFAWVALARVRYALGDLNDATAAAERAIDINPNFGLAHNWLGMSHVQLNAPEQAIAAFDAALSRSPKASYRWVSEAGKSLALLLQGRYEDAVDWSLRAQRQPNATYVAFLGEICAQAFLGKTEEAKNAVARTRQMNRDFGIRLVRHDFPLSTPEVETCLIDGLQRAGLE